MLWKRRGWYTFGEGGKRKNMNKIARKIAQDLVVNEIIDNAQIEEYAYGLEVVLLKAVNYSTIIALAIMMKRLMPTLFFLISYIGLRGRTGGYHAKSAIHCYLGTVAIYMGVVFLSEILLQYHIGFLFALAIVSGVCILSYAPVNNENLCLSKIEMEICRKSACVYVIGIFVCVCVLRFIGINPVYIVYCLLGIILDAGLLFIEVAKERRVSE